MVVVMVVAMEVEVEVEVEVVLRQQSSYRGRSFYFYFCLFKPKNEEWRLETKGVHGGTNKTRDGIVRA